MIDYVNPKIKAGSRITEMWAYVSIDPEDDVEGVLGMQTASGWLPLVGADGDRMKSYEPMVKKMAAQFSREVKLVRFNVREDLKVVEP